MANLGLFITLFGGLCVAIGGFIWNKYSSKSNRERHTEVMTKTDSIKEDVKDVKDQVVKGVDELKEQMVANEKILITPPLLIVPAKSSRDVNVVVTNNYPYPVFMAILTADVIEGDIDLGNDCEFLPLGSGFMGAKHLSYQIPQLNSGATQTILVKVNGDKYKNPSKVKLSIDSYMKEPPPNFSMGNMKELPKTIKLPDGFVPEMHKNDSNNKKEH